MFIHQLFFVLLLIAATEASGTNTPWGYDGKHGMIGPGRWAESYENCSGSSQSPIDIVTAAAVKDTGLGHFERDLYINKERAMTLKNNGHSVQTDITSGELDINNTKLLPFEARLAQYHFHWAASPSGNGSEHALDGNRFFGELHLVHYNTKYRDASEASSEPDGLAVLGFFVQVQESQNNDDLDLILNRLSEVPRKDNTYDFDDLFSIETIFPQDISEYYRYKGSLTTPPCYESVVWTLFKQPIIISTAQAVKLSTTLFEGADAVNDTEKIGDNYRPLQELNGRQVTMPAPAAASSSSVVASYLFSFIASTITVFMNSK